jgi:hypothetical protein
MQTLPLSARDSWLTALVPLGEGYHNYRHEFPSDYRNGVKPWQFDPTKWIIWTLSKAGRADARKASVVTLHDQQQASTRRNGITMISTLISLLIAGLVLYVIYFIVGMFIKGRALNIIGIILGLVFLLYALRAFHVVAI